MITKEEIEAIIESVEAQALKSKPYICSICGGAVIFKDKAKEISKYQTVQEIESAGGLEEGCFFTTTHCGRCNKLYYMAGDRYDIEGESPAYDKELEDSFEPTYSIYTPNIIKPAIMIIPIHAKFPENAKKILIESFGLTFYDKKAGLNRMRTAIEVFLKAILIAEMGTTQAEQDKIREARLNENLIKFGTVSNNRYFKQAEVLRAAKWLGNEGSHDNEVVDMEVIVEAYHLISYFMHIMYEEKEIMDTAAAINTNKGFVKKV